MKRLYVFAIAGFILFLITSIQLPAQHVNVLISAPIGNGLPTEPAIVINPANTSEILVAGMPDNAYYSTNGGIWWTHEIVSSPYGVNADPVLLVDSLGRFYYIHLPNEINRIICHRKPEISAPWNFESFASFDNIHEVDKEWASYDPVNHIIYLSWTYFDDWGSSNPNDSSCIYLSRSSDGGASWSDPVRVSDQKGNAQGGNYSAHGSYNTTGPNGEIYVAWFGPSGLMFDRSTDQGTTWLTNDINTAGSHIDWIYSIPGVNLGVTFPFIACDRSGGPHNGNIYISWADKRNGGNDADVFIVRSTDGGITWSLPIRINDDLPGKHQFFPTMTVDPVTGKIWVVFFDRRNYTDTRTDVYIAVSEDGGNTFKNSRISETPFIPFNTVFFGHYLGVAANDDHVFSVWNRMDDGENSLICGIIDPAIVGVEENNPDTRAQIVNYPNPFAESSFVSFRIKEPSAVTLQLFDISGNLISTLIDDQTFAKGKFVRKIDSNKLGLAPGFYILKLSTDKEHITTRALVVER